MHVSVSNAAYDLAFRCLHVAKLECYSSRDPMYALVQAVIAKLTAKDTGRFLGTDGKDIDY